MHGIVLVNPSIQKTHCALVETYVNLEYAAVASLRKKDDNMRAIIKCPYCGRVAFSLMPHIGKEKIDVECVSCQKVVATVNAGELKERRIDKNMVTPPALPDIEGMVRTFD